MSRQCATSVFTRVVTVAEGVFTPGHLGELTQHVPCELVDDVLVRTRAVEQRLRRLPSRVGVYFLLPLPPAVGAPGLGGRVHREPWDLKAPA